MKTFWTMRTGLLAALVAGLTAGCVTRERVVYQPAPPPPSTVVYTTPAPPPPQVEVRPVAPRPGYVWVPGAWVWRGHHWHWAGGYWAYPPRPGAVWVGGHYEYRGGVSVYVVGGWR